MLNCLLLQRLLRPASKLTPGLTKQSLAPLSTQSFFNNVFNAVLLKESETTQNYVDYDYTATHVTIMELLDCGPGDAIHIIEKDPDLLRLPAANLMKIKELCRDNRIPHPILRKNLAWVSRMTPCKSQKWYLLFSLGNDFQF